MEARYPGDPRGRPARAFCAVSATGSFRRRRDELIDKAVVCSFDGNSHEVDALSAGDMLREKFNLHHGQYQLVKHFPEQFFIVFSDPRSKQWALDRRSVSFRGRVFHFGDWSEDSYARRTNFEFRVKVRVEGIPVHCWGEEVASKALGKSCAIHYVQERTRRRERTGSFDLWAWCSDPCDIPKEVMLTVLEPDRDLPPVTAPLTLVGAQHDSPADLKAGHVYTLRNHIEVVEDLSFLRGRGARGEPPNRKQRREFVWSYGAPDTVGEKRERAETCRGREMVRRDWGHDDDNGDFHRDRRSGNRRHRSLSGWARSSRCRGGLDDCYSSNDRNRHSTPFRRRGLGLLPAARWVPKGKVSSVSFADPVVTAVWPQEECHGPPEDVGGSPASMPTDVQVALHGSAASTHKVNNTVDLANVFTTIHKSLDSVPVCSLGVGMINMSTTLLNSAPAAHPIECPHTNCLDSIIESGPSAVPVSAWPDNFLSGQQTLLSESQLVNDNRAIDLIMPAPDLGGLLGGSVAHVPVVTDNQEVVRNLPSLGSENLPTDNTKLIDFIATITKTPEPPLISSPPQPHLLKSQKQPATRRSSVRLAAKKCIKPGRNRDAISKAQEIILAKLNNSAVKKVDCSSSSNCSNFDESFEQMTSLLTKPLSEKQMDAIMELLNQDKVKTAKNKKKGRKVMPAIEDVEAGVN
jgi:hypothetical protein